MTASLCVACNGGQLLTCAVEGSSLTVPGELTASLPAGSFDSILIHDHRATPVMPNGVGVHLRAERWNRFDIDVLP